MLYYIYKIQRNITEEMKMTSEEIIKVIEDNNYYAHTNEDIELCYAVSHLGYVEYNNHILLFIDHHKKYKTS